MIYLSIAIYIISSISLATPRNIYIYESIHPSFCSNIYIHICSIYRQIHLDNYFFIIKLSNLLAIHLSIHLPMQLFIYLSIHLFKILWIYKRIIYPCFYPFIIYLLIHSYQNITIFQFTYLFSTEDNIDLESSSFAYIILALSIGTLLVLVIAISMLLNAKASGKWCFATGKVYILFKNMSCFLKLEFDTWYLKKQKKRNCL